MCIFFKPGKIFEKTSGDSEYPLNHGIVFKTFFLSLYDDTAESKS